ncbi:MmpS family transport accessory protein [Streptomyces narbonensis]|uniref:MmpS family transport accessory protein n=1 Tax=Streptomyces narbonensis TaxID=67333 RepID=UPI0033CC4DE1
MPTTEDPNRRRDRIDRSDRGGVTVAAALLLVCGAFVTYGFLSTQTEDEDETAGKRAATPTAEATYDVTYEVLGEGAAEVSYRGAGGDEAHVVTRVGLPWRKTVSVPLGASPIVNVTLDEKGGTASCTLAVRGRHVQRATATGAFGRTACGGEPPTTEAPAAPQ